MELKAIWMDVNEYNMDYWGMIVDDKGTVIEGGIREAVWRGLVTEENCWYWWGLRKMENGDLMICLVAIARVVLCMGG